MHAHTYIYTGSAIATCDTLTTTTSASMTSLSIQDSKHCLHYLTIHYLINHSLPSLLILCRITNVYSSDTYAYIYIYNNRVETR